MSDNSTVSGKEIFLSAERKDWMSATSHALDGGLPIFYSRLRPIYIYINTLGYYTFAVHSSLNQLPLSRINHPTHIGLGNVDTPANPSSPAQTVLTTVLASLK